MHTRAAIFPIVWENHHYVLYLLR